MIRNDVKKIVTKSVRVNVYAGRWSSKGFL